MSPLTSRLSAWLLAAGVAALLGGGFSAQTTRELFPNTDDRGRAAVAYEDDALQIVAAYYYSQRHHDSRWVLIELAVSAAAPTRIWRSDISLVTPHDRIVPVASQRAFSQDHQRTRLLRQTAETTRHPIGSYLRQRPSVRFQWFVMNASEGIVSEIFDVDQHRSAVGDLYFASPTGAWSEGTYSLVVETDTVRAVLPIDLE